MKAQYTEKKAAESQEAIQKRHEEEVTFLKKINAQLKVQDNKSCVKSVSIIVTFIF